jgi:TetR/AcrR family transcriptional regulator, repressor for uid operon
MTVVLTDRDPSPRAGDLEGRAVAGLLACLARQGIRKTTLDDVAREAGCSRATLYRYFPSKQAVLDAAIRTEQERVVTALLVAAACTATLEDAVVALLTTAGTEVGQHPALRFVADFEPERLLPHLCFSGGDRLLAAASLALAPALAPAVGDAAAPRAAEWVARVVLCFLCEPDPPVDLRDEPAVRAYARHFLLPAVQPDPNPSPPTRR